MNQSGTSQTRVKHVSRIHHRTILILVELSLKSICSCQYKSIVPAKLDCGSLPSFTEKAHCAEETVIVGQLRSFNCLSLRRRCLHRKDITIVILFRHPFVSSINIFGNSTVYLYDDGDEHDGDEEESDVLDEPRHPVNPSGQAHHLHRLAETTLLLNHQLLLTMRLENETKMEWLPTAGSLKERRWRVTLSTEWRGWATITTRGKWKSSEQTVLHPQW